LAEDVAQSWLNLHCQTPQGVRSGLVVLSTGDISRLEQIVEWPQSEPEPSGLLSIARASLTRRVIVTRQSECPMGTAADCSEIAVPLASHSALHGAVALRFEHVAQPTDPACQEMIEHLRSGIPMLEGLMGDTRSRNRMITALELIATALAQDRSSAVAAAVATELASRLACERVSIGLLHRGRIRIAGLSNTARFDACSSLASDLEAAMYEAADQDALVCFPAISSEPPRVAMAHEDLVQSQGSNTVCTVPLGSRGQIVGAITFEWSEPQPQSLRTVELCKDVGTVLGPILELKRQARQSILGRLQESIGAKIDRLRTPGQIPVKVAAIAGMIALGLLGFSSGDYRVTAGATLEGRVQRAVVAGIDGFVAEANVRAGDLLKAGQMMARLDDRDLLLEQQSWIGKRAQLVKEYRKALAEHDRSQVNFLSAKIDQAEAEYRLREAQLERTRLAAPFDGLVVKGDLSQSLGSPVERGDVLFEVAPLDGYRIVLKVDQRDIGDPAPGQPGLLALAALPGQQLPFTVRRITPVSIAEDGINYFRVEAHLDQPLPGLRPGMEGVGKISIDRRKLIWIWTHEITDWLRLWAWSWLP